MKKVVNQVVIYAHALETAVRQLDDAKRSPFPET